LRLGGGFGRSLFDFSKRRKSNFVVLSRIGPGFATRNCRVQQLKDEKKGGGMMRKVDEDTRESSRYI